MKNIILFDSAVRNQLLPLTYTRPVAELRCGILSIREKWEKMMSTQVSHLCESYLAEKFPLKISEDNFLIDGSLLPSASLCESISALQSGEVLRVESGFVAARLNEKQLHDFIKTGHLPNNGTEIEIPVRQVSELCRSYCGSRLFG